jgi:signal transduction histidine kinase/ActR/RegA family two-component response regulator
MVPADNAVVQVALIKDERWPEERPSLAAAVHHRRAKRSTVGRVVAQTAGWLARRSRGDVRGYAIGCLAVVLAAALGLAFDQFVEARSPFLLLLGAVMTAAWLGGLRPGLATTLLASVTSTSLFMPIGVSLTTVHAGDLLNLGLFVVAGCLASVVVARLRAARDQAAPGTQQAPGGSAEGASAVTTAQELQAEIATLDRLGLTLAGHLDLGRLVKAVTDAGVAVTGAAFGAFLYRDAAGVWTHCVSGAPPEAFVDFPLFQNAEAVGSPFRGAVSRSDDLACDPRFGQNIPFKQMPSGLLPARSYLAAPVRSGGGDLLGGLFLGHPNPSAFHARDERLIAGLAAHAAIAVDNAHLYREAQEARSVAEAASRVKDEFLANLSHELRTPLTAIIGWAYLLQRGQLAQDEANKAIDTIIRNATAQNQIIDQLLDVSRIVTGKLQLDLQPVEIGSVLRAAIGTVTPAADAKSVLLQLIQNPAGSCVMGDPERLQQVFWNLLSNAVKFTPKNGRVRVSVQSIGSRVEVAVMDTGLGIDAAFLPHVFARFSQRDSSSTRSVRGLGLGLAIARQLVELHGGSIQAESSGIGQGSTFTVKFPRSPVTATPANGRVYSQADRSVGFEEAPDLTGIRVLIVEDDDDARVLVAKVIEGQGASVKVVSSAREALDALEKERIDVLLSDIEMPGTDGYQLIRELRLRPSQQGGNVPAAALTAYARTEDRLRALRAGFQLHLSKPVQPAELITVVASLATRPR